MKIATLKILILGGTHFLGIHLTEELVHRGHEVTLKANMNKKGEPFDEDGIPRR